MYILYFKHILYFGLYNYFLINSNMLQSTASVYFMNNIRFEMRIQDIHMVD